MNKTNGIPTLEFFGHFEDKIFQNLWNWPYVAEMIRLHRTQFFFDPRAELPEFNPLRGVVVVRQVPTARLYHPKLPGQELWLEGSHNIQRFLKNCKEGRYTKLSARLLFTR